MQDNTDKKHRFSILFEKYLKGECTNQEAEEILALLEDPGNDQLIKEKAAIAWNMCSDIKEDRNYTGRMLEGLYHQIQIRKERENKKRFTDRKWFQYLSRAAAILILPVLIYSLYLTARIFNESKSEEKSVIWQSIKVPAGVQSEFSLPDGSHVWLNSGSLFKYPGSFTGGKRQVELVGEGYFNINRDPMHPFIVNARDLTIEVKGTQFVVVNYEDDPHIEVILESGNLTVVSVDSKDIKSVSLTRTGEKATYDSIQNSITIQKVDIDKYTSWKDGILIFRDDPLSVVAKKLSRKFNVDIELKGLDVEDYVYTATFRHESLTQILELLEKSAPIKYTRIEQRLLGDNSYLKPKIIITKLN